MDFRYQLDGQLRSPLAKAIQDAGENCVDTAKRHVAEDTWRPTNLETSQNLQKLLTELDDLGIGIPSLQTNDCWIPLTYNTLTFSKIYVSLLEDCLSVATPELISTIDSVLVSVMRIEVQHLIVSLTDPKLKQEVSKCHCYKATVSRINFDFTRFPDFSLAKISTKQCSLCARRCYRPWPGTVQIHDEPEVHEVACSERTDRIRVPVAYKVEADSENFNS